MLIERRMFDCSIHRRELKRERIPRILTIILMHLVNFSSKIFRTIGTHSIVSLRCFTGYLLSILTCSPTQEYGSRAPRERYVSILVFTLIPRKPEDTRLPTFSLPRTFPEKGNRADHIITSSQNTKWCTRTIREFILVVSSTGHALRMTDARPPWQRGRRRTEEERRSHWSRISSASETAGDRSESGSHVE